ncbi:triose-phosphate isomerase [Chitinibacteraceae bacterium HSL-7]
MRWETRRPMVVANWKMHGSLAMCRDMLPRLVHGVPPDVSLLVCPPAPFLAACAPLLEHSPVVLAAQNVAERASGARTGQWSAGMLADLGCRYSLVGHSECRQHYFENDALIAAKARACQRAGLTAIVCVGESLDERERGMTAAVLRNQLDWLMTTPGWRSAVIAYEPLWAIGSGCPATPQEAQQVHAMIRDYLAKVDAVAASAMPVLYGGSVRPDNAAALLAMSDVDGLLVGGASLDAGDLLAICAAGSQMREAA